MHSPRPRALALALCAAALACGDSTSPERVRVTISAATTQLPVSLTLTFSAQVSGTGNGAVTWSSSRPDVATIDGAGVAKGISEGTTVITGTSVEDPAASASVELEVIRVPCLLANTLDIGVTVTGAFETGDCELADGSFADVWRLEVDERTLVRIDQTSDEIDAYLWLTPPGVVDPLASRSALLADDDGGAEGTDARMFTSLPPGEYLVWANTFPGEQGAYELTTEMPEPVPVGPPAIRELTVFDVGQLQPCTGGLTLFVYQFEYEDSDGDLFAPGGIRLEVVGQPSGEAETKSLQWDVFGSGHNGWAGNPVITSCEAFGADSVRNVSLTVTDSTGTRSNALEAVLRKPEGGALAPPARLGVRRTSLRQGAH